VASPFGSAPAAIIGAGVGTAASIALAPAFEPAKQQAWRQNPNRILDAELVARLVAQGAVTLGDAHEDGLRHGYSTDKIDALVYLSQTVPPIAQALNLWRRGLLTEELWHHVLVKSGLDGRYLAGLTSLKTSEPLDPAVVATAIQRGIIHDPGFLPVGPPTESGKVRAFPVSSLDALREAEASGIERDRLFVQTAIVGLPASPDLAARMTFREIIEKADYRRAIAEGNTRNEWADAMFEGFRQILTANQYAELELRGYLDTPTRRRKTAQHGMSSEDSDLLFDVLGRSIPVHQVTTGKARGGHYRGDSSSIPDEYLDSLKRGNLRPEYYSLAYANRYSYPSAFFLGRLLSTGVISAEEGEQIFLELGWRPDLARTVAQGFAAGSGKGGDPHVGKAESQLWSTTHRVYIAQEASDSDARARFGLLGIPAADQDTILELWQSERELRRASLSPTQVKKAVGAGLYSRERGLQELVERGYSPADAQTFLDE
jgi:hypothetical protein